MKGNDASKKDYASAAKRQVTSALLALPSPPQLGRFDESNKMTNQRNRFPPCVRWKMTMKMLSDKFLSLQIFKTERSFDTIFSFS